MSDVKPFLAFAAPAPSSRGFADALAAVDVPVQPSPWSPKAQAPAASAPAAPAIDVDALRAEAIERGRAEGLAETAALRARLASLVAKLAAAEAARPPKLAELAADAACTVVGAWSQVHRKDVFATLIRAWSTKHGTLTARVHPDDAAYLEGVSVETDPSIAPGDIVLAGTSAELVHHWDDRLVELRNTIIAALEEAK